MSVQCVRVTKGQVTSREPNAQIADLSGGLERTLNLGAGRSTPRQRYLGLDLPVASAGYARSYATHPS
jgi:hypothetical protein